MIVAWLVSATPRSCHADDDYPFMDDDGNFDSYANVTNCTNDYCIPDEDYIELMVQHIFPKFSYWVLIAMHSIVFVVGLIGNALVCMAVYRNHSMRTVTNYFIVNLAVADLLVLLICLPPSVLWDVTETWFLGLKLCKAVPYLQVSPSHLVQNYRNLSASWLSNYRFQVGGIVRETFKKRNVRISIDFVHIHVRKIFGLLWFHDLQPCTN